jgi:predicted MFS family arabinose efflux permease
MNDRATPPRRLNLGILAIVCFNFAAYVCNGLPLAVLPSYVLSDLDLSPVFVGLVIGVQYIASLLSRPLGGSLADRWGSKRVVLYGLAGLVLSGCLTTLAIMLHTQLGLSLGLLLAGRVVLGVSSALISTPCCTWAIGLYGPENTARVMSWNGIAAYGGTALGAPLGVLVRDMMYLRSIGLCTIFLGLFALIFALTRQAAPIQMGTRHPFYHVLNAVLPNGLAMACSSVGFGGLTAFIALYFESLGWNNAAYCLSSFGAAFIVTRLVSPNLLPRFGGYKVVAVCMLVQSLGLLLIWRALSPELVMIGAGLTGIGVSWVYPGLGVETLARTAPANRGAALSALSLFFDLAIGLAGPLMGLIASEFGYAEVFLVSGVLGLTGFLMVIQLHCTAPRLRA